MCISYIYYLVVFFSKIIVHLVIVAFVNNKYSYSMMLLMIIKDIAIILQYSVSDLSLRKFTQPPLFQSSVWVKERKRERKNCKKRVCLHVPVCVGSSCKILICRLPGSLGAALNINHFFLFSFFFAWFFYFGSIISYFGAGSDPSLTFVQCQELSE